MTAKKYFQQLWLLDEEIDENNREMDELRTREENCSSPEITGMPRGSGTKDKLSEIVAKLVDLQQYVNEQTDRLIDLRAEITRQINEMKDQRSRVILSKRYLRKNRQDRAWGKIAKELHYDEKTIMRLHKKALKQFENEHPKIKML